MEVCILNSYIYYAELPLACCKNYTVDQYIDYWRRVLLQKAMSVYKWKMPKTWCEGYVKYVLYINGFISVLYDWKFGVIPQRCTLSGFDLFENPTTAYVYNYFVQRECRIDRDCAIIKMKDDYSGCMDMIDIYALQLAQCTMSVIMNLQNTKLAYLFAVDNKNHAETIKKIYDSIMEGEPAVFTKKEAGKEGLPKGDFFLQNLKQNYIVSDLLIDMRKILNAFNTDIGIPNANTEKKERMINSEVESNEVDTRTRAEMFLETLQEGCQKVNRMFGSDLISVDWRNDPNEKLPLLPILEGVV